VGIIRTRLCGQKKRDARKTPKEMLMMTTCDANGLRKGPFKWMRFIRYGLLLCLLVFGFGLSTVSFAAPVVTCSSATVTAPSGGGTSNLYVDCVVTGVAVGNTISPSSQNRVSPTSVTLTSGVNTLTASRQTTVTSPDATVTGITGTAGGGFSGTIQSTTARLRFQYNVTTLSTTPAGTYNSAANAVSYSYRVRSGSTILGSGTSTSSLQLIVPSAATSVSCSSASGSSPPGGGAFTLNVDCVVSNSGSQLSPSGANTFSPSTITLTNGSNNLSASLQSTVMSPDSTLSSISGTASGGFTATINSLPATVRVQYAGTTTSTTPSGTYTSGTVTYTWSTL
jgi:trimeric autotransporter adhesin